MAFDTSMALLNSEGGYKRFRELGLRDEITIGLPGELIREICGHYWSTYDIPSIVALARTDKHFYKTITTIVERIDLGKLCPKLRMISAGGAQECGFKAVPAPFFKILKVIKDYPDIKACNVEDDEGVTYFDFILSEDINLIQIVNILNSHGKTVDCLLDTIFMSPENNVVKPLFPSMMTNNVYKYSRGSGFRGPVATRYVCERPPLQAQLIQWFLVQKIFNQCLFRMDPMPTYGLSSTRCDKYYLLVGGSTSDSLYVEGLSEDGFGRRHGAVGWKRI